MDIKEDSMIGIEGIKTKVVEGDKLIVTYDSGLVKEFTKAEVQYFKECLEEKLLRLIQRETEVDASITDAEKDLAEMKATE